MTEDRLTFIDVLLTPKGSSKVRFRDLSILMIHFSLSMLDIKTLKLH